MADDLELSQLAHEPSPSGRFRVATARDSLRPAAGTAGVRPARAPSGWS